MEVVRSPKWENILNAVTATNSAPSGGAAGIRVPVDRRGKVVAIRLRHTTTAGNDARTCTIKLWGYCPGERDARGDDIASTAGWDDMGESYSLASVSADGQVTAFVLESPTVYERLYVEVAAITGTGTALGVAAAFTEEG